MPQLSRCQVDDQATYRKKVWQRLESAAAEHYGYAKGKRHGINTIIGLDASRSPQSVGDWKAGRSPIPQVVIERLADTYHVSVPYLLCLSDLRTPEANIDPQGMSSRMDAMVNTMLKRLTVELPARVVVELCNLAMRDVMAGEDEATIYGNMFLAVLAHTEPDQSTARQGAGSQAAVTSP